MFFNRLASMNLARSPRRLAVVKLVLALEWLARVGNQMPADGNGPGSAKQAAWQVAGKGLMEPLLQDFQRFRQSVAQSIEDRLVGGGVSQIAAGGMDRTGSGCSTQHDTQGPPRRCISSRGP